jgi:hypothetical protein
MYGGDGGGDDTSTQKRGFWKTDPVHPTAEGYDSLLKEIVSSYADMTFNRSGGGGKKQQLPQEIALSSGSRGWGRMTPLHTGCTITALEEEAGARERPEATEEEATAAASEAVEAAAAAAAALASSIDTNHISNCD